MPFQSESSVADTELTCLSNMVYALLLCCWILPFVPKYQINYLVLLAFVMEVRLPFLEFLIIMLDISL